MTSTRRGSGSDGRMWTGRAGVQPHVEIHTENSSHAKKLVSFLPEFRLWTEKSGNFSVI